MALHTFILQPSADIHLLPGQDVQVDVIGFDESVGITNPITSQCSLTIVDTFIATISAGGLVSAASSGITFMTVEHPASGNDVLKQLKCMKYKDKWLSVKQNERRKELRASTRALQTITSTTKNHGY